MFRNNIFHHNDIKKWVELDIIPRIEEWINVEDFLTSDEYDITYNNATFWSGTIGEINTIMLRKDNKGFYYEITILCEDQ